MLNEKLNHFMAKKVCRVEEVRHIRFRHIRMLILNTRIQ
jgi:hypothetical protein